MTDKPEIKNRQASLHECNRQMLAIGQTEQQTVTLTGPAGTITVPRINMLEYTRQGYVVVESTGTKPVDPNAGKGNGGEGGGETLFEYNGQKYTEAQLQAFAEKAGVSKTVKKAETIIVKLQEAGFDPNAG